MGSIGPLIVPDLADLLVGCRLDLNARKSSTEPACNAGHTQNKHTRNEIAVSTIKAEASAKYRVGRPIRLRRRTGAAFQWFYFFTIYRV